MLRLWKRNTANELWHLFTMPARHTKYQRIRSLCEEENLQYHHLERSDNNPPLAERCQRCQSIERSLVNERKEKQYEL